jgi:hypothetical protein
MASVLLSLHMRHPLAAQHIVTFLYECSQSGLMPELVEVAPLHGTVMKALTEWPSNQPIVERAVVLAVLFEHPQKETLFRAAMIQFPESDFLKWFLAKGPKK